MERIKEKDLNGAMRDKCYITENMLADTGCSYNVCGEQICRDLRIRIYPFNKDMQIMDASGNFLKLLGSAVLYVKTQVLGRNTIKKLEVAVQKQGVLEYCTSGIPTYKNR